MPALNLSPQEHGRISLREEKDKHPKNTCLECMLYMMLMDSYLAAADWRNFVVAPKPCLFLN